MSLRRLLPLLCLSAPAASQGLTQEAPAVGRVEQLLFEPQPEHLAIVDLDGDGAMEIVAIRGFELVVHLRDGRTLVGALPGLSTLWTVADHDNDGTEEFLALVDGEWLHALRLGEAGLTWSDPLAEGLGARNMTPRGARPAGFVRDVDNNGFADLVVPVGGRVRLLFGGPDGFRSGPSLDVALRLELRAGSGSGDLLGRVSRRMNLPPLSLRDISGDGQADLQITDGLMIRQYVSGPEGLPAEPTSTVDLKEFEEQLPELRFDPSNIAGLSRYAIWEEWADLNLDGAQDLILLVGGYVLVYLGNEDGIDMRRRRDQLETHGNVLYAMAARIDEDDRPDLVLLRIEDVSLARALTWYLFSIKLDIEVLAYQGLGNGRFAKRPLPQSKKLTLELPSIREAIKQKESADSMRRMIVRLADFDGDGQRTDLVVLDERGNLSGYSGVVTSPNEAYSIMDGLLTELLQRQKVLEVDVEWVYGWLMGRASLLLSLARGREPFFELPRSPDWEPPQAMTARDFDGDRRDEVLVLRSSRPEEGGRRRLVGYLYHPHH